MFCESVFRDLWNMFRVHDSLVRGFRVVMLFNGFRAYAFFFNQFDRWQEEVVKEPPFVTVEIVHEPNDFGIV